MAERVRRLDWVVLLPGSVQLPVDDVVVLGGGDDLGDAVVANGVATAWRRPGDPRDRGALVVVAEDCRLSVAQIARHLGPGGILCMEVDRRRRGRRLMTTRRVGRELRGAGCSVFSAHIAAPDLERPRRFLPIDHPRALRWYLRVLFIAGTPATRAVRATLVAALATPLAKPLLELGTSRYVLIATTAVDDGECRPLGVPIGAVPHVPRPPGPRPHNKDRVIVVTSGYDQASRAVVLPFEAAARSPRFAVKIASSPTTAIGTLREHERLIALHNVLPLHTARAIPAPLGLYTVGQRTACVQSCAAGPLMSATSGEWRRPFPAKRRDLDAVVDWLTEFAVATRVEIGSATSDWLSIYTESADLIRFPAEIGKFLREADQLARTTELGGSAVHQHYDVGPWNVHINGSEPFVIDWETDDLRPPDCLGPALADVLYLSTYWYFLVCSADTEQEELAALVRLFATPVAADAAVTAAREAIDRVLKRLRIERRSVPAALAALWAERAMYTHRRRAGLRMAIDAAGSRPDIYLGALAAALPTVMATWQAGWWEGRQAGD